MKFKLIELILFISVYSGATKNIASYSYFEYTGKDSFYKLNLPASGYFNPVIAGFYPDPSICRKGKDYYLVTSSFSYYPGIPIFTSTDLVNWKQIGHVLDRPSQLNTRGLELSEGIFAPAIEYNPQNNTFYLVTTLVTKGNSGMSFVVKSTNPAEGWSDPIWLPEIGGIDPSISFIDNKAYIVNNENPQGGQIYKGHKAIWMQEFDLATDKMTGPRVQLINGGHDISKKPIWIEGPHLYKIGYYYYLMAAEGGTGFNHSEVIFRSSGVWGPYTPNPQNPILTQRNLPEDRDNKVINAGHADLIQTDKGDWYAVFLASRPYSERHFNTGRETFLLPVSWKDSFPVILEKDKPVPLYVAEGPIQKRNTTLTGNFTWRDDFNGKNLKNEWNMIRTPNENWWRIHRKALYIDALAVAFTDKKNPAFLGRRQQHQNFTASTNLLFKPHREAELAGLALVQNDKNHLIVGKTIHTGKQALVVLNCVDGHYQLLALHELSDDITGKPLELHSKVNGGTCQFFYKSSSSPLITIGEPVDIKHLSTKSAGGFVGCYIGMYATSAMNTTL